MDNLRIYNKLKDTPAEAKKAITGGRLKGFSDINPMYRIKKMTETFGPVGLGWYYEITSKEIIDGGGDEKIAVVDVVVYVKDGDTWSKPIPGTGGSSFVAKEKYGLYTSDECFKMALTDALSVAFKALGLAADVYYAKDPDTKYGERNMTQQAPKQNKADGKQQAMEEVVAFTMAKKIDPLEVTKIIQENFQKNNSKELNEGQLKALLSTLRQKYGSK